MTRHTQYLAGIAAVALCAMALSACDSAVGGVDPSASASSSSPTSTSSTTPTTSSTPTKAPEDLAVEAAKQIVPEYFSVGDKSIHDPNGFDRQLLKDVAISTALDDMQNRVSAFQTQELKASGSTKVESMENPRVDLKLDLKKSPPDVPTVQLDVCIDVSKLNVVDKNGKSVIPADRKPRQLWKVAVANYEYPKSDAWRVAYTDTRGNKTC